MNPQTPDNEVERLRDELELYKAANSDVRRIADERNKAEKEVARLREEANNWHQHYRDEASKAQKCKQAYIEQEKEVARLQELLERAIEIAENLSGGGSRACRELHHAKKDRHEYGEVCPVEERLEKAISDLAKLKAEARLAPAPEEPLAEESPATEPTPEWRELLPEEEIHTGDQVQAKHHDKIHGVWLDVFPYEIGAMPIDHEAFRYRTRRPLPVQEGAPSIDEILRDPTASYWLQDAIKSLLNRDPLDAVRDIGILNEIFTDRLHEQLKP